MKSVKIGEMTLEVPIIQGGMGVGISLGNLAGNVALNGGMGVISTAQPGYRAADFEKNVTRFFDEDRLPQDNALYYYEADGGRTEIPLNTAGDLVRAPYRFIAGLTIEREDIYEEEKGGD